MRDSFLYFLFSRRGPAFLVMFVGLVVAVVRWKHHPRVSLLASSGIVLYIVQSIAFGTVFYFLPRLQESGWSYGSISNLALILEILRDFIFTGAMLLIISAALSQRKPAPSVEANHGAFT
jgi:hypothetical protein